MGQNYRLVIYNNSSFSGNVIVYQGKPTSNLSANDISTLAWLSLGIEGREGKIVNSVQFDWSIDYGFVWSRGGILLPGVEFIAAGGAPVDSLTPPIGNAIDFTKKTSQYSFTNQKDGANGNITIKTDGTVVQGEASIGVSMSGAGVFAIPARPLFTSWFIPHPSYTVALGSFFQGQVMDIAQLSALNPFEFQPGVVSKAFTYQADGTWTAGAPATLGGATIFDMKPRTSRAALSSGASVPRALPSPQVTGQSYYDVVLSAPIPHGSDILDKACSVVFDYPDHSHSERYSGRVLAWPQQNIVRMQSPYLNIEAAWAGASGGTLNIDTVPSVSSSIVGFYNVTRADTAGAATANGHNGEKLTVPLVQATS